MVPPSDVARAIVEREDLVFAGCVVYELWKVGTVKKVNTTFRYVIRLGPQFVHGGITTDLARAAAEGKTRWPTGHFFQVGEQTTEDEARAWAKRNGYPG